MQYSSQSRPELSRGALDARIDKTRKAKSGALSTGPEVLGASGKLKALLHSASGRRPVSLGTRRHGRDRSVDGYQSAVEIREIETLNRPGRVARIPHLDKCATAASAGGRVAVED